ncbi:MAG: chemotaxis protein CheB [Rhodoferax sp.]|uniref:chemotaxis protein CheB n=1 Tax=Rhodoferax sp. TaxID=50421 RepID=UPI001B41173E|nr:chemotaxis protein CheB [Rhodoferax sp.]MBP7485584.1 chemotaxis protein CheB [Aquabacterium sp.]MBP9907605.1 chemotaxis protein CheB [Rhodoferax sp.]
MSYRYVVIGASAGGLDALIPLLQGLPANFAAPILIVEHLHPSDGGDFSNHLSRLTSLKVVEPCDKARIQPGHVYTAPANYHMLVERDDRISLSVDERINWSRPSIDVLFESAAHAWGAAVVGILLSGANSDGAAGLLAIKSAGGHTLAQDPQDASSPTMPRAAIDAGAVDEVLPSNRMAARLMSLCKTQVPQQGAQDEC